METKMRCCWDGHQFDGSKFGWIECDGKTFCARKCAVDYLTVTGKKAEIKEINR